MSFRRVSLPRRDRRLRGRLCRPKRVLREHGSPGPSEVVVRSPSAMRRKGDLERDVKFLEHYRAHDIV